MDFLAADRREFLEEFPLPLVQVHRCLHLEHHHLITPPIALEDRDSFVLQAENLAGLGPLGNFQVQFAVKGRYRNLGTKGRLDKADRDFTDNIIVLTGKYRVGPNFDRDVEIAVWSALRSLTTFAGEFQPVAGLDTRGNLDRHGFGVPCHSGAAAGRAGGVNDLAFAVTVVAGPADTEVALLKADLAGPATGRADLRFGTGLGAAAVAGAATFVVGNLDFGLDAEGRFLKADLKVVEEVITSFAAPALLLTATEQVSENILEDVAKGGAATETEA